VKLEFEYTEFYPVNAVVSKALFLGALLFLLYIESLPTSAEPTTAISANDTAIIAMDRNCKPT
jgi:hypothetical protein